MYQLLALFQAVEADERVLILVGTNAFAHLLSGADHVKHIIPDLERQSQEASKGSCRLDLRFRTAAGDGAEDAGSVDEGAGLPGLDVDDLLLV